MAAPRGERHPVEQIDEFPRIPGGADDVQAAAFEDLEHQPVGPERRQDVLGDGLHDIAGGDGLGQRGGQHAHLHGPPGPGRRPGDGGRAGCAAPAHAGPPGQRLEQGPLHLVRLTRFCGEHGQHADRPVGTGDRQRHAGRGTETRTVPGNADDATTLQCPRGCRVLIVGQVGPLALALRDRLGCADQSGRGRGR
ncbi:hypothetical protein [Streptomyces iakyrus]|uniref:hypothetical protein n=1 Tax=Streptomyces iakyrus TaxID=68219 RepID=UPI0036FA216A